jgi:putative ABC transport system permease protein
VPFRINPNTDDQGQTFYALARINLGVTLEQTKERLRSSTAQFRTRFPDALGPKDFFSATPLREMLLAGVRALLLVLAGAASLVLLIACANVANLLLARATGRSREMAIRMAIGAGRARLIRQLLTESVLLSLTGGLFGLCMGQTGIRALLAANETQLPDNVAPVAIDWRVLGFALAVSLATGILFGLLPALQASRADLNAGLKDCGGRRPERDAWESDGEWLD